MAQRWLSLERACFVAIVAVTLWQVLVPPFVGLADNSDFGKVAGRFSLRQPGGIFEDHFIYVAGKYVYDPKIYWNSGILTSEAIPAWLAVTAHSILSPRTDFDIRWLGVAHTAIATLALWLALPALALLPRIARIVTCVLLTLTLIDVSWVSYWNSFYMDAATLVFLLLTAATGVRNLILPSARNTTLFGCAVLLLLTSKLQHALPAIAFCVYLVWLGRRFRIAWIFAAAGVTLAAVLALTNPPFYHQKAIFNLVFYEFAPKSPDPRQALAEFGMRPSDSVALGMHAFENRYPANDPGWCTDFEKRARFTPILLYYAKHPLDVARHIDTVLTENLHEIRAGNLANFRREDGVPPGTLSRRWNWWSGAQTWLETKFPYSIVIFYLAAAAIAIRRPNPLLLTFLAFALAEFLCATLADVLDTGRHLRVFHAATDLILIGSITTLLAPHRVTAAHSDS